MDVQTPQIWHIDRNDVTFEALIKSGHFANIYKARLKTGKSDSDIVVAKTLKGISQIKSKCGLYHVRNIFF
jgi:hypothetical protein